MKKILLLFTSIGLYFSTYAQNRVFEKAEMVNFGTLNIFSVAENQWTTDRTQIPGNFANYGSAVFMCGEEPLYLTSAPNKWINGYVKHYATEGNTSHVYPVGDETSRFFLSTTDETIGKSISVAWIPGDPSSVIDITHEPYNEYHDTGGIYDLDEVYTIGQWDWIATISVDVKVFVKIPEGYDTPSLRLAGWHDGHWYNLSDTEEPNNGILFGRVPPGCKALTLGKASGYDTSKNISTNEVLEQSNNTIVKNSAINSKNIFFNYYPNPVKSGMLTLDYKLDYFGSANIVLFDMLGKTALIQSVMISSEINTNMIDTSRLSKGFYTLQINDADNNPLIYGKKIVLQY